MKVKIKTLVSASLLATFVSSSPASALSPLLVQFVNVGQGDCELIRTPHGQTILVDAGPSDSLPAVEQALRANYVQTIDLFVITHPHADHYGNPELLSGFQVKEVWDSGAPSASKNFLRVLQTAKKQKAQYLQPSPGTTRMIDGCRLEVVSPPRPLLKDTHSDVNNSSIAFRLSYGKNSFFFPGDAELEAWEKMFSIYPDKLRSDVLKVAHHGSRNGTNSGVLSHVRPKVAVIEVGPDNSYGHPTPIVLRLLDKLGAKVYRTDLDGTVTASSDGEKITWSTSNAGISSVSKIPDTSKISENFESSDPSLLPDRFDGALSSNEPAPPSSGKIEVIGRKSASPQGLVSINGATLVELDSVKGISKKQAEAIVRGRPFGSLEDLLRVPGMTPAKLKRLRSKLTL
ncbi:MAG TPA: helix-hairpin-helix domain-containing protein [Chroococcales cyanobacterium]|jgi:competence protein ComEC